MADRQELTIAEFHAKLKGQGVSSINHVAFICPACRTVQSIACHLKAGATQEHAERCIGFSCVGRRTDAGQPRKKPDGKPCNWTLGGFLQIHSLTVVDDDGKKHPRFDIATPAEARALEASR